MKIDYKGKTVQELISKLSYLDLISRLKELFQRISSTFNNYVPLSGTLEDTYIQGYFKMNSGVDLDGIITRYNGSAGAGLDVYVNQSSGYRLFVGEASYSNGLVVLIVASSGSQGFNEIGQAKFGDIRINVDKDENFEDGFEVIREGLRSSVDYVQTQEIDGSGIDELDYVQKRYVKYYVDNPETLINTLNNCNPTQLDTIKTILGII